MRPARILLLLVALIAGGLAAYLATRGSGEVTVVQQAAAPAAVAPSTQILVATAPIGVGQRLTAASVGWQPWPQDAIRDEYITSAKSPDAPAKISGTVARFEIFQGEPILDAKLVHSDQGFLSAVLEPGMRGVSVSVSAPSASGGFIIPNDRVDVILTSSASGTSTSKVLLSNVKVLAIGTRLGQTGTTGAPADPADPKSQIFTSDAIATLELTPTQGDALINATSSGKISLVLRSVADFVQTAATTPDAAPTDSDTIKIIRYGRQANVTADGSGNSSSPLTVTPAAYVPPVVVQAPAAVTPTAEPAGTVVTTGPNGTSTTTTTVSTPAGVTPVVLPPN